MAVLPRRLTTLSAALLLASCGGGASGGGAGGGDAPGNGGGGGVAPGVPLGDYVAPALESLSTADVETVLARAAFQANAAGNPATIAVVDRVGNVLAILRMTGSRGTAQIPGAPNGNNIDAQGIAVPSEAAAIAKAVTGAYLSSSGNAFSSRTASMIVQEHFPPASTTAGLESGPLFGVQFSQLPCSDLSARFKAMGSDALIGPKRSPLGLSADPGGFPLYKNGVVVGGIGVIADGQYGFDDNVLDIDMDVDEAIALAGTVGFEAPQDIRANRIFVDGTQLRYSDVAYESLFDSSNATFAQTVPTLGALVPFRGYHPNPAAVRAGTAYGSEASGIRASTNAEFSNPAAFVLSDGSGANRYPVRGGTDGGDMLQPISEAEARAVLEEAFTIMSMARAQIRQPLDSRAQVTISLVDTNGAVLGIVRSPDAPIFGIDVSLQKARTAAFFSGASAASDLLAAPDPNVNVFVERVRAFLDDPNALTGTVAFADRSGGNLSRPYFPDGEVGTQPGPLSRPIERFNPFSTGLQSALVVKNIAAHIGFLSGMAEGDTPRRCTELPDVAPQQKRLANGIQIFPGSVPIYRGDTLVGAIGVSGDGIDQDDMIAFLGTHNASATVGGIDNAPPAIRADNIIVNRDGRTIRLRYVVCPFAPFLNTDEQNVCEGL